MSIRTNILAIKEGLNDWAKKYSGSVHIANDVPHLFKLLGESPGAPRIGILFAGETVRNEHDSDVSRRVDRKFWIAVSRGYSLQAWQGKSLVDGIAKGAPMFDLVEDARNSVLNVSFDIEAEPTPYYRGIELLNFGGVTLDCYRIEIAVGADIC